MTTDSPDDRRRAARLRELGITRQQALAIGLDYILSRRHPRPAGPEAFETGAGKAAGGAWQPVAGGWAHAPAAAPDPGGGRNGRGMT
jgi:hypothetical protein